MERKKPGAVFMSAALLAVLILAKSSAGGTGRDAGKDEHPGMAKIPAGCFMMGDHFNEGSDEERPVHKVCVTSAFFMDKREATNEKYEACVKAGKCSPPGELASNTRPSYFGNPEFKDFPVVNIDWNQAKAYCAWAGGRLPREAEWEYAARGGLEGKRYPWGDEIDAGKANYEGSGDQWGKDTSKVGHYPANGWGLHDMAGNVYEWTADWYDPKFYRQSPVDDPKGFAEGNLRVMRGGSFIDTAATLRVSRREPWGPDFRVGMVGVRCVRN